MYRTESRPLRALSKLDDFLLNPQVRTCSVAVPWTSRNSSSEYREPTGDRSLGSSCPEAMFSTNHSSNLKDPEQEDVHLVVTGVREGITYCSVGTASGKQKKARCKSQPEFRSGNTPATLEADQILLAFQQLAANTSSADFNNNIKIISKLPKSLTITMPTFDGKFELFEDLFRTSLKILNQLTKKTKKTNSTFSCVVYPTNIKKHHQPY